MDQKEYLIQPRGGINKPLSIKMAYKALKEGALKCKIDELGTHTMRKTFGYFHYKKFKNIAVLMSIFNHSAESITLKYIGINQDNKDKTMRNFGLG
jgi:integrase